MTRGFLGSDIMRSVPLLAAMAALLIAWRADLLGETTSGLLDDVSNDGPNAVGLELLTQNYYEMVTDVDRGLWARNIAPGRVGGWVRQRDDKSAPRGTWGPFRQSGATRELEEGFLQYELIPDHTTIHNDVEVRANRWGQRDRDYELAKPEGTFRIALVGASDSMGFGVPVELIYSELLEERLNRELAGGAYDRYEVINFSVGGYHLLERLYVTTTKTAAFEPDLLLLELNLHDLRWAAHQKLAERIHQGRELHFDFLEKIAERARVKPGDRVSKLRQRLRRYREPLIVGCLQEARRFGEANDIVVAAMVLRLLVDEVPPTLERQAELAEQEGLAALRIFDAFEGQSPQEIYLRASDTHATPKGHRLLADDLYEKMLGEPRLRAMLLGETAEES